MNPRTGKPLPLKKKRIWSVAPTAALSDALSTAFMLLSDQEIATICTRHPEISYLST